MTFLTLLFLSYNNDSEKFAKNYDHPDNRTLLSRETHHTNKTTFLSIYVGMQILFRTL
jgi:hypothetical protein